MAGSPPPSPNTIFIPRKQATKSQEYCVVVLYCGRDQYFGCLSDRTLAHSRDHFTSMFTCNQTPHEEQATNTTCGWVWLAPELWPTVAITPLALFL